MRRRYARALAAAGLVAGLVACGSDDTGIAGSGGAEEAGEVTLQSDDSTATVEPLCVEDIPEDLTTCPGAPANLGQVELDETRKATLVVPTEVATGGYRVRINGRSADGLEGVLNDTSVQVRVPVQAVQAPGETLLTVEALFSREHPKAVWQFLLSDPAGATG